MFWPIRGAWADLRAKAEARRRRGLARLRCTEVVFFFARDKEGGFAAVASRVLAEEAAAQMVDAAEFDNGAGATWQ